MKTNKKEAAQQLARELYAIAHMGGSFNAAVEGLAQQYGRDRVLEALSDLTGEESSAAAAKRMTAMTNMLERMKVNPELDFEKIRKKAFLATKKTAVAAKDTSIKGAKLTAWKGKDTGLAARVAALEQCVSSLQVSDSSSPTLRDARAALAAHRRTAKYNPGGAEDRDVKTSHSFMHTLLGYLIEIKLAAWSLHWNAKGANFYGTHLMLQRIYTEIDEQIDTLGEKIASMYGKVDMGLVRAQAHYHLYDVETFYTALGETIEKTQTNSDALLHLIKEAPRSFPTGSVSGLDDYLMALNNSLDTFLYLLRRSA